MNITFRNILYKNIKAQEKCLGSGLQSQNEIFVGFLLFFLIFIELITLHGHWYYVIMAYGIMSIDCFHFLHLCATNESLSFSPQRFGTDCQKLFSNYFLQLLLKGRVTKIGVANMINCVLSSHDLKISSNDGLKRQHLEFSSLTTKNIISPLLQC